MTLSQAVIDGFVKVKASGDGQWGDAKSLTGAAGWRPASDCRKELRDDIIARQGGICPVCGNALRFAQFNHIVSTGPDRGFHPLNVFAGCALCNLECALEFGEVTEDGQVIDGGVIPFTRFARPEIIPSEWTPFPILRKIHKRGI